MNTIQYPEYSIEIWEHGVSASYVNPRSPGLPTTFIADVSKLFSKKAKLFMDTGICSHYNTTSYPKMIAVVGTTKETEKWRAKIKENLKDLPPPIRWYRGVDTGLSSLAIFAAFYPQMVTNYPHTISGKSTPRDAGDFERCLNLIREVPNIRGTSEEDIMRFNSVINAAYPGSLWQGIIQRWDEMEKFNSSKENKPEAIRKILDEIHAGK
jgi:hypothetical protein